MCLLAGISLTSCNDDVSPIGGSLFDDQVRVFVDSAQYRLQASTQEVGEIDARSSYNLLGNINVPEYGSLNASYVTRMMCAAALNLPDSITEQHIDSMRMVLQVPRANIVGDSVAPQQLKAYLLNKQLPSDITSDFDPTGYYNASTPLTKCNYTLSGLALSDSAFKALKVLPVSLPMPKDWAIDTFKAYRENSEAFAWPSTFAKYMPGLFIENTFGRGCMAAVQATKLFTYYHYSVERTVLEGDEAVKKTVLMKDSICLFSSAPEVLASNNLDYKPSDNIKNLYNSGQKIITSPLGYRVKFTFPGNELLEEYYTHQSDLSTINNLALAIPAVEIKNDYGIGVPPYLLMIRTSEIDDFFANGKVPDNLTSFYSTYSSANSRYYFDSMRQYLVDLNEKYGKVSDEEFQQLCDFTLIPVTLQRESSSSSYDGTTTNYVTGCTPYLERPTMTLLDTDKAVIVFTYTHQYIN